MTEPYPFTREYLADWLDWCGVSEFQKDRCLRLHEIAERGEVGQLPKKIVRSGRAVHGPSLIISVDGIAQHRGRCGCCGRVAMSPGDLEDRQAADVRDTSAFGHGDQRFDGDFGRAQAEGVVGWHGRSSPKADDIDAATTGARQ